MVLLLVMANLVIAGEQGGESQSPDADQNNPDTSKCFIYSFEKDGEWHQMGQHYMTHALESSMYRKMPIEQYVDEDGYVTMKIEWTDKHILDKLSIVNAVHQPYKSEVLALEKAQHSTDGNVKENLMDKDYEYAHTVRGDVIDLEFDVGTLTPNEDEVVDYFFESYGFYHGLRTYLYPEVDTSDSYKEEINQYVQELNNYLKSKNQWEKYRNPFIK